MDLKKGGLEGRLHRSFAIFEIVAQRRSARVVQEAPERHVRAAPGGEVVAIRLAQRADRRVGVFATDLAVAVAVASV